MTMMMGGKVHRTRSKARRSAGGVPGAFLQGVDGTRIPLMPDDYRRVREFLLAEPERAVADDERITTGEAARILGVSQRTLTRMLDAGMIPYTRMGERSYRFLRLSDVTDYKRRRDEATSKALDEMRSIADEDGAIAFTQEIIDATLQVGSELTGGETCFTVLDAPYPNSETRKAENYFISEDDFKGGVKKGIAAGALLGIIAEGALYTFWLILYRKPKSAEEVRACLDIPVIDDVKTRKANEEEVYKKLALFLKEKQGGAEHKGVSVNCMPVGYFKKDAGLKLAMSFANEKKKTLLIDLVKEPEGKEAGNSISRYVLGDESRPVPTTQNSYLDVLCRDVAEEKNFDVVMNERFASYVKEMQDTYEYIVINSPNVAESADAFAAGKLCDKNFVVCARGGVNNETLYRLKNEAAVQGIVLEGVLVYEL